MTLKTLTGRSAIRTGLLLATVLVAAILCTSESINAEVQGDPPCPPVVAYYYGNSVAGGVDLNADGVSDFMVGASNYEYPANKQGKVYVYSGRDSSLLAFIEGPDDLSQFGYSIDFIGDESGDGISDILIGAPGYASNKGKIYIYSGRTFSQLHTFTGEVAGDRFGYSVSGAGDVNNDNQEDMIIGAPGVQSGRGRIYVRESPYWYLRFQYNGAAGAATGDSMGYSVSGAGDVNNDNYDDVIVGAPWFDGILGPNNGRTYVLSGNSGSLLCYDYGPSPNAHFGWSVSGLGDVDNDGKVEFMVGAPGTASGNGMVQVSKDGILPGDACNLVHTLTSPYAGAGFGHAVARAGYVDTGSVPDIVIGAPLADGEKGRAYVYLANGWSQEWQFVGNQANSRLGFAVASAGDVGDEDGHDDVIVSTLPVSDGKGQARIYSGDDCSLICMRNSELPYLKITHPTANDTVWACPADTVRWISCETEDLAPQLVMKYSTNGGVYWQPRKTIPNSGKYAWDIPAVAADNCLLTLCPTGVGCPSDTSGPFAIKLAYVFQYPQGQTLQGGSSCSISWSVAHQCSDSLTLWYKIGKYSQWVWIASMLPGATNHTWTVPHVSASPTGAWLKLTAEGKTLCFTDFSIREITAPLPVCLKEQPISATPWLSGSHPNPFNPSTEISYNIPEGTKVALEVYNIMGQKVRKLVDEHQAAGIYQVTWDGKDDYGNSVSSGVYFYRLRAGEFLETKKMLLVK